MAIRNLSSQQLTDMSTVMYGVRLGYEEAKRVDPSAKTVLRQIPNKLWRDPVWQNDLQGAYARLVASLTSHAGMRSTRLLDMPAFTAALLVQQIAGALSEDGTLVGVELLPGMPSIDPVLMRWAAGDESPHLGATRGQAVAAVAAAGILAFAVAKVVMSVRG